MSSPVTAQLILIQGDSDNFQQVIDLHNVNQAIGRAQNCDIIWGSLQISRRHATLEYMLPKWYIRDTSTNGLSVNGIKLVKGELFALNDTDIINFIPTGSVRYRFRYVYNNNSPRTTTPFGSSSRTNYLGNSSSPQPSTSTSRSAASTSHNESASRAPQTEARGRPSVEYIGLEDEEDRQSESGESNHSESLLSLDPPDGDFLSFSGDEHADVSSGSPPPSAESVIPDSDENSLGTFAAKRKLRIESDSDNSSLLDHKKKRMFCLGLSSDEDSSGGGGCANNKSDESDIPSTSSSLRFKLPDRTGFLTDEQIAKCCDLETLKAQLKQSLTTLASTEVKLKTIECERIMEKEEYSRKETDIRSVTAAIKEENYKKILDLLESELSCAVCNEVFIQATVVDCGHTFCSFCINEWSKKKTECPICRKPFRNKSRHIELENFVTRMFESFNEEISTKRKASIKDREEQVKKAEEASRVIPGRPGAPGVNNTNFHTFMQRTAETYVDFLAELHQFNELLGPSRPPRRGNNEAGGSGGTAAERRRSARIQDRVIDAVATGASGAGGSRSTRRGRPVGSRGTRNAAAAAAAFGAIQVPPPPAIPPTPAHIPVVNLDDSSNGGNANPAPPYRFPNQILNWLF